MVDGQNRREWAPLADGSLSRRAVLKLAAVPLLSESAVGETTRNAASTGATTAGDVTAAERTTSVGGGARHATAVALDGRTGIAGVPPTPETAEPAGRAVVFARSGGAWTQQATLSPDGDGGQFGRAVALEGDTAVVGGELGPDPAGDHAGSAAVFVRSGGTWRREATLRAPVPAGVDLFGTDVAVAGDTVLVGASAARTDGKRDSGAAFVFSRSSGSWQRETILVPAADGITEFGRAVALDGDTAAIGARHVGESPGDSGAVFVYGRRGGRWHPQAELMPPGRDRDDGFGAALATAEGTVLAGAPSETNEVGMNAGGAYVFARQNGGWRRQATLRHDGGSSGNQFGTVVALSGTAALVGTESGRGPVVFGRSKGTWSQAGTLRHDGETSTAGVALDGARAVVGVRGSPDRPAGSVEVFEP